MLRLTNRPDFLLITRVFPRILTLLFFLPFVALTSCVEGEEELWINDDASGHVVLHYKIPSIALRRLGDPNDFIKALELIDEKEEMIEITKLSFEVKSSRAIFHLEAKFDDARELLSITERNKPIFAEETSTDPKDLDSILGDIDFRIDGITPAFDRIVRPSNIFPPMVNKRPKMLGSATFKYCIHLPTKVKETNAHSISDDGKTVSWIFELRNHFEDPIDMTLRAGFLFPWWTCLLIVTLIVIILGWLMFQLKRRNRT